MNQRTMLISLLMSVAMVGIVHGECSNSCNGHGVCELSQCRCFDEWTGGSCELKKCARGHAWNDFATGADLGHNLMECSNRGSCDRTTGVCQCDTGFAGSSCQYMDAPNNCWGRGKLVDMTYNAKYKDPGLGTVYKYDSVWDAGKIYGCICDRGFTGYDCSLQECPRGDDPMTENQLDEVQIFNCVADNGFFTLQFQGFTSEPIAVGTSITDLETILEAIPGIGQLSISFSEAGLGVCLDSLSRKQIVTITFLSQFGNVYRLVSPSTHINNCNAAGASSYDLCGGTGVQIETKGGSLLDSDGASYTSVSCTKESLYCSGRGTCDLNTGICACFTNFETSDGRGLPGVRGDCGFRVNEVSSCPGAIACSGHGVCSNSPQYKCTCSTGWTGGDCSERQCPTGKSWFDVPIADNRAHQLTVCSNMGVCDIVTGLCSCYNGFEGAACNQMKCPGVTECSGHGQCLSMAQLANKATVNGDLEYTTYGAVPNNPYTWDYDMIHGCKCDPGYEGHDCSQLSCPYGDDPETGYAAPNIQYHEIKVFKCTADSGNLKIYFRQELSDAIPYNTNAETLKAKLVALNSITDVEVTYSSGNSMCTAGGSNVVSVKFTQDLGTLPHMIVHYDDNGADLLLGGNPPTVQTAEYGVSIDSVASVTGTKENWECSGRGTCDHTTGKCACYTGYGSSDGNSNVGVRGDCGYKIPYVSSSGSSGSGSGSASNNLLEF